MLQPDKNMASNIIRSMYVIMFYLLQISKCKKQKKCIAIVGVAATNDPNQKRFDLESPQCNNKKKRILQFCLFCSALRPFKVTFSQSCQGSASLTQFYFSRGSNKQESISPGMPLTE